MKRLEEYIVKYGHVPSHNVLKVDAFLNHQIDTSLMMDMAQEFAEYFKDKKINKIVTIETSGIAPSVFLGYILKVPVVFFKKNASCITIDENYSSLVHSFTKDKNYDIICSKKYLNEDDHVLFVDDFLANGEACLGAMRILEQAGATLEGVGIVVEKSFQDGRNKLDKLGIDVCSLARISSLDDGKVEFLR